MEHRFTACIERSGDKDAAGNICYIIGITKAICQWIGKSFGDTVDVTLRTV